MERAESQNPEVEKFQIDQSNLSYKEKKQKIIDKRGVFKWLPVYSIAHENDLVHGSWWYVWGSVLTILIPVFPLIALYEGWWPDAVDENGDNLMPKTPHAAGYSLMIFAGVWYTIGSYIFINCFRDGYEEDKKNNVNMFGCKNTFFRNDELIGIWCFIIGTIPFIPLMCIYVYYNPETASFKLALGLVIFVTFGMFVFILAVAPEREDTCIVRLLKCLDPCLLIRKKKDSESVQISIFVPCFRTCCCCIKRHVNTDWLIACWIITIGCFLSVLMSIAMLIHSFDNRNDRGIYDYATCLVDMLLFFVGSLYLTAGSYDDDDVTTRDSGKISLSLVKASTGA